MKTFLELEVVGEYTRQLFGVYRDLFNSIKPGFGDEAVGDFKSVVWVAEITGFDPKYKFAREFIRCKKDYSRANSKGSKGVYEEYILESGRIYDISDKKDRYFCMVNEQGDIIKMNESEVIECLKSRLESMSLQPQGNE
jgi:hypothetical protein